MGKKGFKLRGFLTISKFSKFKFVSIFKSFNLKFLFKLKEKVFIDLKSIFSISIVFSKLPSIGFNLLISKFCWSLITFPSTKNIFFFSSIWIKDDLNLILLRSVSTFLNISWFLLIPNKRFKFSISTWLKILNFASLTAPFIW